MVATVIICIVIAIAVVFAARRASHVLGRWLMLWEEAHEEGLLLMLWGRKREEGFPREAF